jgi:hypothetical protein
MGSATFSPTPSSAGRPFGLVVRIPYTLFVAVLVPFYWDYYGPANFLWFCDIAVLLTLVALWLPNRLLASMQLVAIFLGSLIWLTDFLARLLTGHFLIRWTHYMFRPEIPLVIRALSLFHAWLPFLLLWMVWRLGYDKRGWLVQSVLAWVVLPICFFCTDPRRALNGVFGPSGEHPQTWMAPEWWLLLTMVLYPIGVFLPSHLLLMFFFRKTPSPGAQVKGV